MPDQISKFSATDREQVELDRMSLTLANLDWDSRMCVIVNSLTYEPKGATSAISSLAQLMVALAATLDDEHIRMRVANALIDAGHMFGDAVTRTNPLKVN